MGNICRSPAAEGVFRKVVAEAGRAAEFGIDSAGTHGYHVGHAPDPRMQAAAERRGYRLDSVARRLDPADFQRETEPHARGALLVKMLNTGQACISPNRLFVQRGIMNNFVEELKGRAARLKEKGVIPGLAVVLVGEDPA